MNSRENENGERDFSIELNSSEHRFLSSSNGANGGVLIEGTLGRLQRASFVEPEILEVKGNCGVLRVNLRMSEITVVDAVKKCAGGESE
ncbi:MAG: hypothetical protein C4K48_06685 [Candidatus Thorarchaeota archaeon]|nr:MAG: hypothetical protein C4K48_06685 [Candidatus Thorarchaeota archaeon]